MSQKLIQLPKYEEHAQVLETTKIRQITGALMDGRGGGCALFVLSEEACGQSFLLLPMNIRNRIFEMNDHEGKSFKEIAQWLREQK